MESVGGAMLSFGRSCVRKAGRSESRSAASLFYLLVRLSGTEFLCSSRDSVAPPGHGSMAAVHTLSCRRVISADSAPLDFFSNAGGAV